MASTLTAVATRTYSIPALPGISVTVADLGLACCSLEVAAAITAGLLVAEDRPAQRQVLLVSGTANTAMAEGLAAAWAELPEPRLAVAFGACTITGGPYWDSPTVLPGVDAIIPIDAYVPGCPPRPEAIIDAITALVEAS